jgi:hypothetical protein
MADIKTIDQVGEAEAQASISRERAIEELEKGVGAAPGKERAVAQGIAAQASIDTIRNLQPSLTSLMGLDHSSIWNQLPPPPEGIESRVSRGPLLFQGATGVEAGQMAIAAINQLVAQTVTPTESGPQSLLATQINERDGAMASLSTRLQQARKQIEGLRP